MIVFDRNTPMAWLPAALYDRFVAQDPDGLFATHQEWFQNAQTIRQQAEQQGLIVHAVDLDPDRLAQWCKDRGVAINSQSRADMAGWLFDGGG